MEARLQAQGYTLVELIAVLVVVGIIAAVAVPRFMGSDAFRSRGFYDQATSTVRYAQKIAIAQRRPVFVCVNAPAAGDISVSYAAGCATQISDSSGVPLKASAPGEVTLTSDAPGGVFSFVSGLGRTSARYTITLNSTIADDPARSIVIENETGYVHPGP